MNKKSTTKVSDSQLRQQVKAKKRKGKPSGSRNSIVASSSKLSNKDSKSDPRLGSKKPVNLFASKKPKTSSKPRYATPQAELLAIENDPMLLKIMDKLDGEVALSKQEQHEFNRLTARHKVLCELIGDQIPDSEPEPETPSIFTDTAFSDLDNFRDDS